MKRMIKKAKAGFTLVELVVVIAIIAVLGAVSVLGYFAFIDEAKNSNDVGLVNQLNLALKANEALDGGKNNTYYDAIEDIKENGIDMEEIKIEQEDVDILWDQTTDRFVLADEEKIIYSEDDKTEKIDSKLWKIYDAMPTTSKYSIYLTKNATGGELTTNVGLDTGKNQNVTKVIYTGSVPGTIIRTDITKVDIEVNNSAADLDFYGLGHDLTVLDASLNSVHIYGTLLGRANLLKGGLVVENGSKISNVEIDSEAQAETIKLTIKEKAKVDTAISMSTNVQITENSSNISIPTSVPKFNNKEGLFFVTSLGHEVTDVSSFRMVMNDLNKAPNGATVTFLKDATIPYANTPTKGYTVNNKIFMNFNGHKVTFGPSNGANCIFVASVNNTNANLTLANGKLDTVKPIYRFSSGTIVFQNIDCTYTGTDFAGVTKGNVYVLFDKDSKLTAHGKWAYGFSVESYKGKNPTFDIYGTLDCYSCCLFGNGTDKEANTTVNIYDGALLNALEEVAVYFPQRGTFNIYGGKIESPSCIGLKSGNLNIYGGELHANSQSVINEGDVPAGNSNGIDSNGAVIHIETNSAYTGSININIEGGKLISDNSYGICEITNANVDDGHTNVSSITIKNATMKSKLSNIRCSESLEKLLKGKISKDLTINLAA